MSETNPVPLPPASTPTPASNTAPPHRPPDDEEEVYYEGSPLLRGQLGKGFLWIVGGLVLIALAIASPILKWPLPWWLCLAVAAVGFICIVVPLVRSKTIRYRVSNYRIDYERGLLGKNIDTLELWHVEDVRFAQSLIDRILGVGNITVISHDESMPLLVMHDIPHSRELFEKLKQRIIAVKRSRGVMKVDAG